MKKVLAIFLLTIMVFAEPKEMVAVSLGSHCEVASQLNSFKLRYFSSPVDWLLSLDHQGLVALIDDEFQFLFDKRYLYQPPEGYVLNSYYKIDFRHDWTSCDLYKHLPEVQEKYERRIKRFFDVGSIANRVFFVRSAFDNKLNVINNMPYDTPKDRVISAGQARELRDVLEKKFSHLRFLLIIINYEEEDTPPIQGIRNVLEFKVRKTHKKEDYAKFAPLLADPLFFDRTYKEPSSSLYYGYDYK